MNGIFSRRKFLKLGVAAASTAALLQSTKLLSAKESKPAVKFDKTVDIIIVGSGVAGTTAAIRAAELGNTVLLLEKMSLFGGTSLVSGLNFACVNSPFQAKEGIRDSADMYAKDMAKVGGNWGSYEHALMIGETTRRVYDFWTSKGVKFLDIKQLAGHSVKRALWADGGGRGIIIPLHKYIETNLPKCQMQKETKVDNLIFENGRVIGVEVRTGYRFNYDAKNDDIENNRGNKEFYRAKKGVIMASGGYCRDAAMLGAESKMLGFAQSIANPGALSGTIKMLNSNGAHLINMALFRFAYATPTEDFRWGIILDQTNGKRILNEMNNRNTIGVTLLRRKSENGGVTPIYIFDQKGADNFHDKQRLALSLESKNGLDGTIYKFNTIDEIATHYKINPTLIKTAVADYNKMIDNGKDDEFGKDISALNGAAIKTAPFYTMLVNPRITYTPGGVKINTKAEVLSMEDGSVIKGLYAAGEVTGGIHGEARLTAGSSPDCGTFGLIAAENIDKIKG